MALHNELGEEGEKLAAAWLREKGYEILHINWKYSYYEIDIIARMKNVLHIVEVKARKYFPGANPEDNVNRKKFKRLQKAADQYLFLHPEYKWIQYDIISITLFHNRGPEFFLLEDVFFR